MTATNQLCEPKRRSVITNPQWSATRLASVSDTLNRFFRRFRYGFRTYMQTVQIARMQSVLANLTDFQLEQIGITRAEIATYSERLFSNDTGHQDEGPEQNDRP